MWHFHKIPKILHLYWGTSNPLPYLRYLTVETFIKHNPEWHIKVHYCSEVSSDVTWNTKENTNIYAGEDYFPLLKNFESVELIEKIFEDTFLKGAHDIHKSDFTRWEVLYKYGGFWSDFDILYLKSMNFLFENKIENKDSDTLLCVYSKDKVIDQVFPIGFFGGSIGNLLFKDCFGNSKLEYKKEKYQCLGAKHLRQIINNNKHKFTAICDECVYPIYYPELEQFLNQGKLTFKLNTIGFHWYAGSNINMKNFLELFLRTSEFNI